MSLHTDLLAVADLLRRGHCKGHFAIDSVGAVTLFDLPDAVCWCLSGAIKRVCGDFTPREARARRAVANEINGDDTGHDSSIVPWNDESSRTQAEVVALVERAAAKAKESGR